MQNSELFRKGIVVPTNEKSKRQMLKCNVDRDTDVIYWKINDRTFSIFWDIGIFDKINDTCNSTIDEYEEEFLEGECLAKVSILIHRSMKREKDIYILKALANFQKIVKSAIDLKMPIFFIL